MAPLLEGMLYIEDTTAVPAVTPAPAESLIGLVRALVVSHATETNADRRRGADPISAAALCAQQSARSAPRMAAKHGVGGATRS